ncbi:PAS domain-containing sensor histidine kinase [Pontibacter oryzae]|nr:PAS domain-containing protein [Pontibacter oryzae]
MPGSLLLLQANAPYFTVLGSSYDFLQVLGTTKQSIEGKSVFEIYFGNTHSLTNQSHSTLNSSLENALAQKKQDKSPPFRHDITEANGEAKSYYWSATNKPVVDAEGNVLFIIHAISDETEQVIARKKTEELQDQKFRNVVEQASDAIAIFKGEDLIIETVNPAILDLWQHGEEILNQPFEDIMPEMKRQGFIDKLKNVLHTGEPIFGYEVPAVFKRKNGNRDTVYFNFSYQPYREADGTITGVIVVASNVSEQVKSKQKVIESESRFLNMIKQAPVAILLTRGHDMVIENVNALMLRIMQKDNADEAIGKKLTEVLPEVEGQAVLKKIQNVLDTAKPFSGSEMAVNLMKNGHLTEHYFNLSYTPIIEDGIATGVLHVAHDVTEQIQARKRVEESEARFRNLVREASVGIIVLNGDQMQVNIVNDAYAQLIDRSVEELDGKPLFDIIPEAEPVFRPIIESVKQSGEPLYLYDQPYFVYINGKRKDGFLNLVYQPYRELDGTITGVIVLCHNVTEQVIALKNLEESARDLQIMANAMPQLVWIARPDGKVVYYNERIAEFDGTEKQPDGTWTWKNLLLPTDAELTVEAWAESVREKQVYDIEHRLKMKDGTYRWHLSRAFPQLDSEGNVIRWFGTATDVHQRKESEEMLAQKNLQLVRINNDLDNFIYTASHDLKAPISNIEGLLGLLNFDLNEGKTNESETRHIIQMMQGSVERFKKTISSLTDVVKLQQENTSDYTPINLYCVLEDVTYDLSQAIQEHNVQLELNLEQNTEVSFTEKNLRSVIYNLLSNAIKYRSPERKPHIKISSKQTGEFSILTIEDNGLGIDPKRTADIFTMFKRFHDHVEGTGIGLYMVKKMIENAGGRIEVESEVEKGSSFKVYFKK